MRREAAAAALEPVALPLPLSSPLLRVVTHTAATLRRRRRPSVLAQPPREPHRAPRRRRHERRHVRRGRRRPRQRLQQRPPRLAAAAALGARPVHDGGGVDALPRARPPPVPARGARVAALRPRRGRLPVAATAPRPQAALPGAALGAGARVPAAVLGGPSAAVVLPEDAVRVWPLPHQVAAARRPGPVRVGAGRLVDFAVR